MANQELEQARETIHELAMDFAKKQGLRSQDQSRGEIIGLLEWASLVAARVNNLSPDETVSVARELYLDLEERVKRVKSKLN